MFRKRPYASKPPLSDLSESEYLSTQQYYYGSCSGIDGRSLDFKHISMPIKTHHSSLNNLVAGSSLKEVRQERSLGMTVLSTYFTEYSNESTSNPYS
ncbi:hypothetical protein SCLCIDRAFT_1213032, partial [Scleroderma citrinum Foug A]